MPLVLSGDGITSDNITSLAASKLTGQVPDANAPSGSVIQVVQATTNTTTSSSSSTYTDATGLSVSITPISSTSKILIVANIAFAVSTMDGVSGGLQIVRNSTAVYTNNNSSNIGIGTPLYYNVATNLVYLDSPATTSATTYKIQLARRSFSGAYGGTCSVNDSSTNNISSITAYEVTG